MLWMAVQGRSFLIPHSSTDGVFRLDVLPHPLLWYARMVALDAFSELFFSC